jgi:hypothetical protein
MSERTSRIILGIEALVICLPLTVLFLAAGLPSAFYFLSNFPDGDAYAAAVASIIILGTLFCAWLLIFAFVLRGGVALRRLSSYWWLLPFLSAAVALAVTVHLWLATAIEPSSINTFGWGIPFLVPLAHLCAERWGRRSANPLLNTDARQETPRAG